MEIFNNKFLVKLIASICLFLTLLNFGLTNSTYAADSDDDNVLGGTLITPVMQLLTGISDGIVDILHSTILRQSESLIRIDGQADSWWAEHGASVIGWIAGIVVLAVVIIAAIPSGGTSIAAGAGILANIAGACFVIKTAGVAVLAGITSGVLVGRVVDAAMMADDIYLPVYKLTPEEIFANEIPVFDVNFF